MAFYLAQIFKVSIYIPEKARADALKLSLDDEVKEVIENSKQMGKIIEIECKNEEDKKNVDWD